jgi:hypothetical protein
MAYSHAGLIRRLKKEGIPADEAVQLFKDTKLGLMGIEYQIRSARPSEHALDRAIRSLPFFRDYDACHQLYNLWHATYKFLDQRGLGRFSSGSSLWPVATPGVTNWVSWQP